MRRVLLGFWIVMAFFVMGVMCASSSSSLTPRSGPHGFSGTCGDSSYLYDTWNSDALQLEETVGGLHHLLPADQRTQRLVQVGAQA